MVGDQRGALKIWEKYITELYDEDAGKRRSQLEDTQMQKKKKKKKKKRKKRKERRRSLYFAR
jgi:hypothetical protein